MMALCVTFGPQRARAQWQTHTGPAGARFGAIVGSDVERYVRVMLLAGIVRPLPWAVRPYSPDDLVTIALDSASAPHPWQHALHRATSGRAGVAASLFASANSGFAWGANDGAMWQGRGANVAVGAGAAMRYGPLTAVAAPLVFTAQNASFPLLPQISSGVPLVAEPAYAAVVDLPQRMGTSAYSQASPGESALHLRAGPVVAGLSSASVGWGTGEAFPAIFGSNSGGFSHVFLGTRSTGARVPTVGRLTARYMLGVLEQSAWSPVQGSETFVDAVQSGRRRLGTGMTVSFMPAILPTLEVGASRFFHSPFRSGSERWAAWSKPFEGIFKKQLRVNSGSGDPTGDADNQMASFFARWMFPKRGVEANFELFREDHNWDSRDLAQEAENNGAVLASVRAVLGKSATQLSVLSLEYFDGDIRPIAQVRPQDALYVHTGMRQGHTQRGQLLGAPLGVGAVSGQRVALEQFTSSGSRRASLQRWRTRSQRTSNGEGLFPAAGGNLPYSHDWLLDAGVAVTRYRTSRAFTVEGGAVWAGRWQLADSRNNLYARASWTAF
jgi:hypothetical protein